MEMPAGEDHAQHQPSTLPSFVPPVTDEDRKAAFPDVTGHPAHDNAIHAYVLADQLEWQDGSGAGVFAWDAKGWIGRDLDRVWFRTEGAAEDGRLGEAEAHVLYGRAVTRWWDVVLGVRQDVRPGPARTWAAIGLQGLAPYWFDVEATAYVGEGGRTQLRLEVEYDLLLTNRLIVQPVVELQIHGKADPDRGVGAGLSSSDVGVRLRYEIRREFAPYLGVTWGRLYLGTADAARAAGEDVAGRQIVVGVRVWQ
jgi:copper resistance protein B